jgi:hypothetical protein
MRHRAKLLAVCGALVAAGGLGCHTMGLNFVTKPTEDDPPDVLVRGYLVRNKPPPRFAYHAYLVFFDRSEATRPQREAAIRAFTRLLTDVSEYEPRREGAPDKLAVLFAPVTRDNLGPQAKPEEILQAYDYELAQYVTGRLARQRDVPPLYLLGSALPLDEALVTPGAELYVAELKGDQERIEATITNFNKDLLAPAPSLSGKELVKRVLAFFDSVGGFVIAIATLGGGASPSKP